jgi:hypothetical protein
MAVFLWDEFEAMVTTSTISRTLKSVEILPAYTQDGILLSRVFQGATDSAVFEDYIEQLLQHCGR